MELNSTTIRKVLRPFRVLAHMGISLKAVLEQSGLGEGTPQEIVEREWNVLKGSVLLVSAPRAMALPESIEAGRFLKLYTEIPHMPLNLGEMTIEHLQERLEGMSTNDKVAILKYIYPLYKDTKHTKTLREILTQTLRCLRGGYPYFAGQGILVGEEKAFAIFVKPDRKAGQAVILEHGKRKDRIVELRDIQAL